MRSTWIWKNGGRINLRQTSRWRTVRCSIIRIILEEFLKSLTGKISTARAAALKHGMRSMHRMMQSSGTTEGLRGLLDSSLVKSVKKILENGNVFGPSILAIGKQVKSTVIPMC